MQLICCILAHIQYSNSFATYSHSTMQLICCLFSLNNATHLPLTLTPQYDLFVTYSLLTLLSLVWLIYCFLPFNDVTPLPLPLIQWHKSFATCSCLTLAFLSTSSHATMKLLYHFLLLFNDATLLPHPLISCFVLFKTTHLQLPLIFDNTTHLLQPLMLWNNSFATYYNSTICFKCKLYMSLHNQIHLYSCFCSISTIR